MALENKSENLNLSWKETVSLKKAKQALTNGCSSSGEWLEALGDRLLSWFERQFQSRETVRLYYTLIHVDNNGLREDAGMKAKDHTKRYNVKDTLFTSYRTGVFFYVFSFDDPREETLFNLTEHARVCVTKDCRLTYLDLIRRRYFDEDHHQLYPRLFLTHGVD